MSRKIAAALALALGASWGLTALGQTTGGGQGAPATETELKERAARAREERSRLRAAGKTVELLPDYFSAIVGPVPASLGVDAFYKKHVDANGIPVLSSERVPDTALIVMRDIINTMLAARSDLRKSMIERGWRTGVIGEVEMTPDIPEYANNKRPGAPRSEPVNQDDRDYHSRRSRGLGGNPTTGAEENLLGYPGTRYFGEHIFVHEFAHAIMSAVRRVDPAMHDEIVAAYDAAKAAGKYVGVNGREHYALTNANEYWAEGVQWWFFSNYGECFKGNVTVESPEDLKAYDPVLFGLLGRVFDTHRIPMDIYHGRKVREVQCPPQGSASRVVPALPPPADFHDDGPVRPTVPVPFRWQESSGTASRG